LFIANDKNKFLINTVALSAVIAIIEPED